jgi:hypothetical protein
MFLTNLPLWVSGILLVVLPTLLAMAGPILVRRRVRLERLSNNNEVAGFKFATIGVLYAVLLAFAVVVVWEKFSDAEDEVAQEAGAVATIYRLLTGAEGPSAATLREDLTAYVHAAIGDDWPAMAHGHSSPAANQALDHLYAGVLSFHPADQRGAALFAETLHQLDTLTQARRARLAKASGVVPGVVWLVLFGGAAVTIGFTFFFGSENLHAQALMTGALALLICSGLLVIAVIDHPFSGTVKVQPEALRVVLDDFAGGGTDKH